MITKWKAFNVKSIRKEAELDFAPLWPPILSDRRRNTGCFKRTAGKNFRAIVETVDREDMAAVHAIRTGPHGSDPQRMRGTDGVMRRDIDRDYHLHNWSCRDRIIELASVNCPHDNYCIPE